VTPVFMSPSVKHGMWQERTAVDDRTVGPNWGKNGAFEKKKKKKFFGKRRAAFDI